ncbi:hypothetical protein FHT00_000002 [Sphingomonas insulae]|uniref:hypothetical protein n=1 Tax=Sphingomonas insulae TaxID=424800 RepID=UPI0013D57F42|nr:hypothetical protein [Sphingomonas insulae]NIJ28074.1 hypothetical protein [Sphingomonas insulae]
MTGLSLSLMLKRMPSAACSRRKTQEHDADQRIGQGSVSHNSIDSENARAVSLAVPKREAVGEPASSSTFGDHVDHH